MSLVVFEAWRVSGGVCISVLLMMREWDVAGRCCAGRGWWCAMACFFFFLGGGFGFHTSTAKFCKFNQAAEKE